METIEELLEAVNEVKIEVVEDLHEAEAEEVEPWVPDTHKLWKVRATFIINLDQKLGHVLTSKIAP